MSLFSVENICIMEYFSYLFQEDVRIVVGVFYSVHFSILFILSTCVNYRGKTKHL